MKSVAELRDLVARLEGAEARHREKLAQLDELIRKFTDSNAKVAAMLGQLAMERDYWARVIDELVRIGVVQRPKFRPVLVGKDKLPPGA